MATEEQKKASQLRLIGMTVRGTAMGIWDMVGDAALSLGPTMGEQLLQVMEQEMGLEIAGENPEDVLNEIARLFVDEFGFAQAVHVAPEANGICMTVDRCVLAALTGRLVEDGVDPFICPYRNSGAAALLRQRNKARTRVTYNGREGCVITFQLL